MKGNVRMNVYTWRVPETNLEVQKEMDEVGLRIVTCGEEVLLQGSVPAFSFHKFVPEKIDLTVSNSWTSLFEVTLLLLKYSRFVLIRIFGERFSYSNPTLLGMYIRILVL